nr:hypothetical protein [Anaerolineae bacterium]
GVDVEILVGETGAERSLTVIGAGEQVEVGTTPGISVRFLVKPVDELSDVTRGAARIEVPQGSICRVPIHE